MSRLALFKDAVTRKIDSGNMQNLGNLVPMFVSYLQQALGDGLELRGAEYVQNGNEGFFAVDIYNVLYACRGQFVNFRLHVDCNGSVPRFSISAALQEKEGDVVRYQDSKESLDNPRNLVEHVSVISLLQTMYEEN